MKEILTRLQTFITFDLPLRNNYVHETFIATHQNYHNTHQNWCISATRKKVISKYWFRHVLMHFCAFFLLAIIITLPFNNNLNPSYFTVCFTVGLFTFVVLIAWFYWPVFYRDFLPILDTVIATYEGKEQEMLNKCKQAQLSNFTLALIFYALSKKNGATPLFPDDHHAQLLTKLFGVDRDSMKKNLVLILNDVKDLSSRKLTVIHDCFEEAYDFFETLQLPECIHILQHLKEKFKRP